MAKQTRTRQQRPVETTGPQSAPPELTAVQKRGRLLLRVSAGGVLAVSICNLFLSGSLLSILSCVLVGVFALGLLWGDAPLRMALAAYLLAVSAVNLTVLVVTGTAGAGSATALIWLAIRTGAYVAAAVVLFRPEIRDYLQVPRREKQSRIHFFHGGWRDL